MLQAEQGSTAEASRGTAGRLAGQGKHLGDGSLRRMAGLTKVLAAGAG